jgi:hypothetical protein
LCGGGWQSEKQLLEESETKTFANVPKISVMQKTKLELEIHVQELKA